MLSSLEQSHKIVVSGGAVVVKQPRVVGGRVWSEDT